MSNRRSSGFGFLVAGFLAFKLFVVLPLIMFAGFCHEYCLESVFGRNVPWYSDVIAGFFSAPFTVPGMFVCWAYRLGGMATPFIN